MIKSVYAYNSKNVLNNSPSFSQKKKEVSQPTSDNKTSTAKVIAYSTVAAMTAAVAAELIFAKGKHIKSFFKSKEKEAKIPKENGTVIPAQPSKPKAGNRIATTPEQRYFSRLEKATSEILKQNKDGTNKKIDLGNNRVAQIIPCADGEHKLRIGTETSKGLLAPKHELYFNADDSLNSYTKFESSISADGSYTASPLTKFLKIGGNVIRRS